MDTRRIWRLSALLGLVAALALVIAACGDSEDSGSGSTTSTTAAGGPDYPTGKTIPSGPVELEMWWWGEQEAKGTKAFVEESIALYEKKHPNVTIKPVLQTTTGLIPTFETAAAAGEGPDIQFFWGGVFNLENAWKDYIRPVGDYLPADELPHYINGIEDTYDGKLWAMPWYVVPLAPVLYREDVMSKAGVTPPKTWDELLAACDTLNKKGIVPISAGLKDAYFGAWLWSNIAGQNVDLGQVLDTVSGDGSFAEPPQSDWWTRLEEMADHKCFNEDINSRDLYEGQEPWIAGDAAMTIAAGSDIKRFVDAVGEENTGIMAMPVWNEGEYSGRVGSTSQTLGITKTTKYPQVAADFLLFLHSPERLNAFHEKTGAIPADDRFDADQIKLPQQQWLMDGLLEGYTPYLENFIPTELDAKGILGQVPQVISGDMTAEEAAQGMATLNDRLRRTQPERLANFKTWAATFE